MNKMYESFYADTDSIKVTLSKSIINWLGSYCDEDEKNRRQRILTAYLAPKIQAKIEYMSSKRMINSIYGIMCKGGYV